MTSVAVIGAGLAGLAAADHLRAAGIDCTLFDKSRSFGGRMSTRRVDEWQFDHGAQYFTARGEAFQAQVQRWVSEGVVAPWFDESYVGTPGMTAPARALAAGMKVVTGCEVAQLRKLATGWSVDSTAGLVDAPGNGKFDAVIVAVPAPQAQAIFARSAVHFPAISQIRYAPCWALMLALDAPLAAQQLWWRPEGGDIAWIARNSSKPQRSGDTLVVHASPSWSRDHLEDMPDDVLKLLIPKVSALIGEAFVPIYGTAHRWRFALVEQAVGEACLWNDELRVGACGDWCLGPRVECAYDSGLAMAQKIVGCA